MLLSVCLSVAYIANNSRTQRPSVPKFERKVPHLRCNSHTSFKVKWSEVSVRDEHGHSVLAEPGGHTARSSLLILNLSVATRFVGRRQSGYSSSSRMSVIYHNWSATKQRPHPQSVAEISRHSVLSGDGFDNVRHRLGLATRTQISVCKSPFPSAGTAVSQFRAKMVQQRPLLPREDETWLPDCGVTH